MKLSALSLVVPDYESGLAFYKDVMGFKVTEDIDQGRKRWIKLTPQGGGASFILARADNEAQKQAIGAQGGGRVWLFLESSDFEQDHRRLKSAGVHFEEAPRQEPYGTVAVFRDPFGNRWDLIQYAEQPQ
ncbi:MAG: VOC family protein [Paracoccaceae bacterium]